MTGFSQFAERNDNDSGGEMNYQLNLLLESCTGITKEEMAIMIDVLRDIWMT
jgi:hypothetical protein